MAVKSGKNGSVTWGSAVSDVQNWSIDEKVNTLPYASSSTAGATKRVAGVSDFTGTFEALTDTLPSGMTPGATSTFSLKSDADTTVYTGTVMIEDITYALAVSGYIKATVKWGQA